MALLFFQKFAAEKAALEAAKASSAQLEKRLADETAQLDVLAKAVAAAPDAEKPAAQQKHDAHKIQIAATQAEVAKFSTPDSEKLPAYYAMLDRVAAVLKDLLLETPPNVGGGIADILQAWKLGKRFKKLGISR